MAGDALMVCIHRVIVLQSRGVRVCFVSECSVYRLNQMKVPAQVALGDLARAGSTS